MHAHLSSPAFLAYQAKAMCGAHRVRAIDSGIIFHRIKMICARSIDLMCNMTHEADSKRLDPPHRKSCFLFSFLFVFFPI